MIGVAFYRLVKYLTITFDALLSANIHIVKSSISFAQLIRNLSSIKFTMVALDVKSLFTKVPSQGVIDYLEKILCEFHYIYFKIEELLSLTRTCLSQTTFSFQDNFYKQADGPVMRGSPIFEDFYMCLF